MMQLVTYSDGRVGQLVGSDRVVPLVGSARSIVERWGSDRVWPEPAHTDAIPFHGLELRPPLVDPSKIMAAPVNYRDHQTEMNVDAQVDALGLFLKAPSSLLGSGGTVQLPYHDRRFDQEGELAVVIGRTARNVSERDALAYVFGYTGLLDITMRGGEDRSTRKSFDTFTPMGPILVTADEFGDPGNIDLRCWVNDELRQEANTSDLIWSVARLISYASSVSTLFPGDILTTGTPAGVGPIEDGDEIRLEISGFGIPLLAKVSAVGAVACPTSGSNRAPVPPKIR